MHLHALPNAFAFSNKMTIYSAGINKRVSATMTCQTWPDGSCRS